MIVEFPNMGLNFKSASRMLIEDEAVAHANRLVFCEIDNLPFGYEHTGSEFRSTTPLHHIEVR